MVIRPYTFLGGIKMEIKILDISDEEFEKMSIEECNWIENTTVLVRNGNIKTEYKTAEQVLDVINAVIGVLNIEDAKEFVFENGDRRNENKELYDELLLDIISNSDELLSKPFNIITYREEDIDDWGIRCGGLLIGYDIKY